MKQKGHNKQPEKKNPQRTKIKQERKDIQKPNRTNSNTLRHTGKNASITQEQNVT